VRASHADIAVFTPTTTQTLTAQQMLGGCILLDGAPGNCTLTTPSAAQLVAFLANPFYLCNVDLLVVNSTISTMTFAAGSGVNFAGNLFILAANTQRYFKIWFTNTTPGSESVDMIG
jgi:hypothetical protein